MYRLWLGGILLAAVGMMLTGGTARAGGWALVTLDSLPVQPRAEQAIALGFMVRRHGVTPINDVGGARITPVVIASNTSGDGLVRVEARQEGVVGHFVADITFPSAGVWEWQIAPEPFPPTRLEALIILTVSGAAPPSLEGAGTTAQGPAVTIPGPTAAIAGGGGGTGRRSELRWLGLALLMTSATLVVARRVARLPRPRRGS